MPYSPSFLAHLENPRNVGDLPDANAIGEETNPVCGDRFRLSLRVEDGKIKNARFLAYGCPPTLVCGSALTELLQGKTVDDALAISRQTLIDAFGGLPSRKRHAASLALQTLRTALETVCRKV